MTKHTILLFAVVITFFNACKQAKQDQFAQRKLRFDYNWKFQRGDFAGAGQAIFDDAQWRQLDLPHDWSIEGEIAPDNPTGNDGGYFPAGIGWYRKTFEVPNNWDGKKISVYFEGVYMNAEVFINGKNLGVHPYGYTSFYHDLTPYIEYGKQNVIAVKVDNSIQKNCRWYSGSGIYRHVWLQVTAPLHIDQWGVAITTPEVSKEAAIVKVETTLTNETANKKLVSLQTRISGNMEAVLANQESTVELEPDSKQTVVQVLKIANPSLWSPASPSLYTANISVVSDGAVIDEINESFGVRTIEYSAEAGFLLNGIPVILNGGCVHHDNGCLGAKAYDRAEERKVELLKKAGFNAVRTAHNPPSEAFLEACDRLGLLVMDEAFDGWRTAKAPQAPMDYSLHFDEWWQKDIESMVYRDRNHPSIIMWSIGNEIMERTEPQAVETANMLATYVCGIDPTRPVTSAMTTWGQGWEVFDSLMAQHDIAGYNYQLFRAEDDHKRVPDRVIVNTESYPKNAFLIWDMVQKHDYIIGDFVWTAMDYLGESGIGRYYYPEEPDGQHWEKDFYPWHGAYCGDIDLTGWRKPISHYRGMLYNDDEKLYMAVREPNPKGGEIKLTDWAVWPTWERWNWSGYEGDTIEVEVYSKYPSVRLYLNETMVGEKSTTKDEEFKATFFVPYTAGSLKAVGMKDGNEVSPITLHTAGEVSQIKLSPDQTKLVANSQDLSFVTVELVDKEGVLRADATNELNFSLTGPGVIEGVDNADLKSINPYVADSKRAWNGRAMVVIKSTQQTGKIKLTVSSKGLPKATVIIQSVGQ